MQRILLSMLTIAVAIGVAGTASWAVWHDEDTSKNSSIQAGKLDLQFSTTGGEGSWVSNIPNNLVLIDDASPGEDGEGTVFLKNDGTVNGSIKVSLANVRDEENGLADPEKDDGDTGPGGELCPYVEVQLVFGPESDPIATSSWKPVADGTTWDFGGAAVLNAGDSEELTAKYRVSSDAGNDTMTDRCTSDITVRLDQVI